LVRLIAQRLVHLKGEPEMAENEPRRQYSLSTLAVGAGLVLFGLLFLCVQLGGALFHLDLGRFLWPFYILVPGVLLYIWGVAVRSKAGIGLAIAGSQVTMVGLILLFQAVTGLWATWAYAWALIAPTSIGLGLMLFGAIKGQPDLIHSGRRLATIGLAIFVGLAILFELVIGISGFGLGRAGRVLLPVVVIGIGIAVLVVTLVAGRRKA
jgi:hypothetical protein